MHNNINSGITGIDFFIGNTGIIAVPNCIQKTMISSMRVAKFFYLTKLNTRET